MIAWLKKRIHQEMRRIAAGGHYRPERHYMRGPGPKSQRARCRGTDDGNASERHASASNNLERDDDSRKNHPALAERNA